MEEEPAKIIGWFDEDNVFASVKPYVANIQWSVLPWSRCKAYLERKDNNPHWGRCERVKKHDGWHALERGFDIVWFETRVIDLKQEWETLPAYAKADVEATEAMMTAFKPCDCTAHDITESGASHANDCPQYDGPNPKPWYGAL